MSTTKGVGLSADVFRGVPVSKHGLQRPVEAAADGKRKPLM